MEFLKRGLLALLACCLIAGHGVIAASAQTPTGTPSAQGIGHIETVGGTTSKVIPPPLSYDVDHSGDLNADELTAAITDRYPKMLWPEAYMVPMEDIIREATGANQTAWPIGSEFRFLEVPAVCAWLYTLNDMLTSGSIQQQSAAIDQTSYVLGGSRSISGTERLQILDVMQKARLGFQPPLQAWLPIGMCSEPVVVAPGSWPLGTPEGTPVATPVATPSTRQHTDRITA